MGKCTLGSHSRGALPFFLTPGYSFMRVKCTVNQRTSEYRSFSNVFGTVHVTLVIIGLLVVDLLETTAL
jgi:hypothetical protein